MPVSNNTNSLKTSSTAHRNPGDYKVHCMVNLGGFLKNSNYGERLESTDTILKTGDSNGIKEKGGSSPWLS